MVRTLLLATMGLAPVIATGCIGSTEPAGEAVAGEISSQAEMTASSPDSLPDVVNRWLSVQQGSFDLDGYLALFAEDVAFRDAETGRTAQRRSELAEAVRPFTQLTDMSARVLRHATNENQVFVEGELTAKTPTGASVTSRGVVVFTIADSRITSLTTYLFRQNVSLTGPDKTE